jgi:23S rRNA-/tRNA-specific pseudouridylate synthase
MKISKMPKIKNDLTTTFQSSNIPNLVEHTAANYRSYDPGQYLYKLAMDFSNGTKFCEKFIELTYTTLIAWNMNQRGAKLSEFTTFKESLMEHENIIQSLEQFRIEKHPDTTSILQKLKFLYENLQLVAIDKPKLVTFSKTLHFFLPNLLY